VVVQQVATTLKKVGADGAIDLASVDGGPSGGIYAKRAPVGGSSTLDFGSPLEPGEAAAGRSLSLVNAETSHDGGEQNLRQNASAGKASNRPQPYHPIVRPYRSDDTPRPAGNDPDLDEAKQIAQDADNWIRIVRQKVRDAGFGRSPNGFLRQIAAAFERYYADDSDRSVAAVGTRQKKLNATQTDDYGGYEPLTDRIHFNEAFRTAPNFEKVVTIIHEILHTIPYMKDLAVKSGYYQADRGSVAFAKYEAQLDNFAKAVAKQLGLIPQNYPPTDWHALVSPK
jgi:hypothetical protein